MGETRSRGDGANVPALWCADARSSTLAVPFPCQVRMTLNPDRRGAITQLAQRWSAGEETAFEELIDLVYDDLRKIARSHLRRENEGGTLDTTALVHEAWVKLADLQDGSWQGRAHFFAFCSRGCSGRNPYPMSVVPTLKLVCFLTKSLLTRPVVMM